MEREIVQWGNSLGLRIPNKVFRETAFSEGDDVTVEIVDGDTLQMKRDTGDQV
jgi:antitoxin component of MazEF toxin-antitoxin module